MTHRLLRGGGFDPRRRIVRLRGVSYFLLIEEELRIRPPHGFVVCGDGTRHRVENTENLRAWVLGLAGQIRLARAGHQPVDSG